MYAQVEKAKRNESQAAASSVVQKKSSGKQGVVFVDNREITQLMMRRIGLTVPKIINSLYAQSRTVWTKATDKAARDHFRKHGAEFGAKTVEEYHNMAEKFISNKDTSTQTKTGKDSNTYFFNPKNDYLAVVNNKHQLLTFFRPSPAIHGQKSNQEYFDDK